VTSDIQVSDTPNLKLVKQTGSPAPNLTPLAELMLFIQDAQINRKL